MPYWTDQSGESALIGCTEHPEECAIVFTETEKARWIIQHQWTWHARRATRQEKSK